MGWKSQPTKVVNFDKCRIPGEIENSKKKSFKIDAILASNLLGVEGRGFNIAMAGLNGGRVNIASCSLGGAQKAVLAANEYLSVRKAFNKPLNNNQYLTYRLAELATKLVSSRLIVRHAANAIGNINLFSTSNI